jgi:predicted transcriptional regulator
MTSVDEESDLSNATDTVSLTVELPRALVERLNALVARSEWSAAMFMEEALADYLPAQERLFTEIEGAIAEADLGAPRIPHEESVSRVRNRRMVRSLHSCIALA